VLIRDLIVGSRRSLALVAFVDRVKTDDACERGAVIPWRLRARRRVPRCVGTGGVRTLMWFSA
jgi:hypothetical protein